MLDARIQSSSQDVAPEDGALGARVLKQVLGTPAFRDILRLHLNEFQRGEGRSLVRTLLRSDPELMLGMASTTPRVIDTVTESLLALGQELAAMPAPLVDAYLSQVVQEIDTDTLRELPRVWTPILARALPGALNTLCDTVAGAAVALGSLERTERETALMRLQQGVDPTRLAAAVNALSVLVIQLERDHPTPGDNGVANGALDWPALVEAIDHGKLREGLVGLSGLARRTAQPLLEQWLADPVAVANLVLALPSIANDGVRLGAFVVERLDLPDEVLASAIFNVLGALDLTALSSLLNGAARTVTVLHQGSATLGLEEPAWKAVFTQLLDGLLESLDRRTVGDAVVALAEDGDVVARVLARRVSTDPPLLWELLRTIVRLVNVALLTGREVLTEAEQLPSATLEELATRLPDVDARAVAELLSQGLRTVSRLERSLSGSGRRRGRWMDDVVAALDWEVTGALLWRFGTPVVQSYVGAGWQQVQDRPEVAGRWINETLERFNSFVNEHPERTSSIVPRLMSSVDSRQLSLALRTVGRLVGGAVVATAQTQPLLQTLLSPLWRRRNPGPQAAQ